MVSERSAPAADHEAAAAAHGYHLVPVKQVREETADSASLVLDVPSGPGGAFHYRPGQFCTFRFRIDGEEHLRSYSMSSAPEVDPDLTVTVKRVPGGLVSNWILDHVRAGQMMEVTRPAGVFCLREESTGPVLAFCGGSGVTPVISIAKSALASTDRRVRILYANRDPGSVIFGTELPRLAREHGDRLDVRHHFDSDGGYLDPDTVRRFAHETDSRPDLYICGPEAFMDLVESTLLSEGMEPDRIFIERFGGGGRPTLLDGSNVPPGAEPSPATHIPQVVTIVLNGRQATVPYRPGDTVLQTARRGGLKPPFSCESGTCATCMAMLKEGSATMRVNHALTPEEVDEGWILTCQSIPSGRTVTVEYESF